MSSDRSSATSLDRELLARIESREARVAVVGLGYAGLPVAVLFAEGGFPTIGFDVDPSVVEGIREGTSHVGDVEDARIERLVRSGGLEATLELSRLGEADAVIICVPTPLSKTEDPDVSYVVRATAAVRDTLRPGQLIVLESTTYPGTTRELVQSELEKGGLRAGEEFFVAYSPERVDPGNSTWHVGNTPKVVAGLTARCHELAVALYRQVIDSVVPVSSPEAAEMTKILENTFRAVNIGLVNEMAVIANRLGIDVWEVIDAASTKPYGFMRFVPGPGLGGHCIPVDPLYLAWKMKTLHYRTRFIELAAEINAEMPRYVATRVADALNRVRKPVNGSRILLVGVAYKGGVDDTRESPALDVLQLLVEGGAHVRYHDPYVSELKLEAGSFRSVPLTARALETSDAVVITAAHDTVDYDLIAEHAEIVVDPRGALRDRGAARALIYPIAGPPRGGPRPGKQEPDQQEPDARSATQEPDARPTSRDASAKPGAEIAT